MTEGQRNRVKSLFQDMKNLRMSFPQGTAHQGRGIEFLPDNEIELLKRLELLIAAKQEGHNSSFNERNAILKRLLEKKFITKEIYKKLIKDLKQEKLPKKKKAPGASYSQQNMLEPIIVEK